MIVCFVSHLMKISGILKNTFWYFFEVTQRGGLIISETKKTRSYQKVWNQVLEKGQKNL